MHLSTFSANKYHRNTQWIRARRRRVPVRDAACVEGRCGGRVRRRSRHRAGAHGVDPGTVSEAIAGLYGASGSLAVGWVAHLVHGTVFGVIFAVVLSDSSLAKVSEWVWKSVLVGVGYGLVLAVVGAGLIMPMWLEAIGFPLATVAAPRDGHASRLARRLRRRARDAVPVR